MNQKEVWGWVALIAVVLFFGWAYFDLRGNITELESKIAQLETKDRWAHMDLSVLLESQLNREVAELEKKVTLEDVAILTTVAEGESLIFENDKIILGRIDDIDEEFHELEKAVLDILLSLSSHSDSLSSHSNSISWNSNSIAWNSDSISQMGPDIDALAEIGNQLAETSELAEIRQAQMNREIGSSNSRIDTLDEMIDIIARYHEEVPHRE